MTSGADVLIVANNFPPVRGGSATVYASLADHAGGRIMVLAPRVNYLDGLPLIGWRENDRRARYRVLRLPLLRTIIVPPHRGFGRLWFLAKDVAIRARISCFLLWLIARERPRAVCLGELLASGWMMRLLALRPRMRRLVYIHGEEITTDDSYDSARTIRRRALLAADRIIVVSRFTQQQVVDLLGEQLRDRLVLVENGVDLGRFRPGPKCPRLTELYHLEGKFVFISVCRLLEKKGIDHALRALAQLLPQFPDTRYLVVGDGPYGKVLRALADELGLGEAVTFTGPVPAGDLVEHYHLGDVFVMPNRDLPDGDTEGFGLVFLEANACGLPVIAGRDGGTQDAVQPERNGLLVDGHSVPDILAAMSLLRADPIRCRQLREGGLLAAAGAGWDLKAKLFLQACIG